MCEDKFGTIPLLVFFKLNFDGSFVQSAQRGGIGGGIRDWNGIIIRNFSGPVDCSNADEAELFALLIGCVRCLELEVLILSLKVIRFLLSNGVLEKPLILGG